VAAMEICINDLGISFPHAPGKYAKIRLLQKCVFRAIWEIETLTCNSDSWIPTCSFISSLGTWT
jgi:hypothetical protein